MQSTRDKMNQGRQRWAGAGVAAMVVGLTLGCSGVTDDLIYDACENRLRLEHMDRTLGGVWTDADSIAEAQAAWESKPPLDDGKHTVALQECIAGTKSGEPNAALLRCVSMAAAMPDLAACGLADAGFPTERGGITCSGGAQLKTTDIAEFCAFGDGKRHGPYRRWSMAGQLLEIGDYDDGRKSGIWTTFHPNGQRKAEGDYSALGREGVWREWWPNGNPKHEGNYYGLSKGMDHMLGRQLFWKEDGSFERGFCVEHGPSTPGSVTA